MTKSLEALCKPIVWTDEAELNDVAKHNYAHMFCGSNIDVNDGQWIPLYSQEYVNALIVALEQSQQQNKELIDERTASLNELARIIQQETKAKRAAELRIAELEASKPLVSNFGLLRKALANAGIAAPETDEELSDRHVINIVKFVAELEALSVINDSALSVINDSALCVKPTDAMREVAPLCVKLPGPSEFAAQQPMSLDSAIVHADERAATLTGPCAEQHAQLASWLRELLEYRKASTQPVGEVVSWGENIPPRQGINRRVDFRWLDVNVMPGTKLYAAPQHTDDVVETTKQAKRT